MNKRGMTIMELIISLAMLSVALVFMFNLMINLQNKKNKSDKYTDNFVMVSEIENVIQEKLMSPFSYGLSQIDYIKLICESESLKVYLLKRGTTDTKIEQRIKFDNEGLTLINVNDTTETTIRKWNFIEKISSIEAKAKTSHESAGVGTLGEDDIFNFNYDIYLKNEENEVIDVIHVPLLFTNLHAATSIYVDIDNCD